MSGDDEASAERAKSWHGISGRRGEGIELQEESSAFADSGNHGGRTGAQKPTRRASAKPAEDEAKELEILSEPLVEDLDILGAEGDEAWDYSFTEEELELLNL